MEFYGGFEWSGLVCIIVVQVLICSGVGYSIKKVYFNLIVGMMDLVSV